MHKIVSWNKQIYETFHWVSQKDEEQNPYQPKIDFPIKNMDFCRRNIWSAYKLLLKEKIHRMEENISSKKQNASITWYAERNSQVWEELWVQ